MKDFYISVFVVAVVAAIVGVILRNRPQRIYFVIAAANVMFAIEAAYFISWYAVLPCLFLIAFFSLIGFQSDPARG